MTKKVYKSKIFALLVASILMLALALPACGPSEPAPAPEPEPAPAPAPEPAPAPKPEPKPEPAPAPAGGECNLSFADSIKWENDDVSVCVPEKWTKNDLAVDDPNVLYGVDPAPSTPPVFLLVKVPGAGSIGEAVVSATCTFVDAMTGPGSCDPATIEILSEEGDDAEIKGDLMGFPIKAIGTVKKKGDDSYVAIVATVDIMAPYKKDQFAEVTHSLTLK
jgi:hypothetical protein